MNDWKFLKRGLGWYQFTFHPHNIQDNTRSQGGDYRNQVLKLFLLVQPHLGIFKKYATCNFSHSVTSSYFNGMSVETWNIHFDLSDTEVQMQWMLIDE